jgi:hypothetical protein
MRWRIGFAAMLFTGAAHAKNLEAIDPSVSPATTIDDAKTAETPTPTGKRELYRSVVRFGAGPSMFFAPSDYGMGVGVTVDFGSGTVGGRVASSWFRSQKQGSPEELTSPTGAGFGQYTGEITVDLLKRGPFHPVFAIGFGMIDVFRHDEVVAGIATGRVAIEYAVALDGADVRIGLGLNGVLLGPAPRELIPMGGYVTTTATIAIGF